VSWVSKSMAIAVIGLGKIGLPLAVQYAKKGKRVIGVDTNEGTVSKVNRGIEPFPGEENLSVFLKEVTEKGHLFATSSYEVALMHADVIVIATPLLIDHSNQPDFSILDSVSQSIGQNIRKGTLVILETTVPIGTTRNRLTKIIEKNSSFEAGKDFLVAFSPERVFTGRIFEDLKKYPKLVGGISEDSALRAKEFYENVLDFEERSDLKRKNGVWLMQSTEAAEFSKLAETTYRDVNIALANQFAKHASQLKLNIHEILEASNSQPFSHIHTPGIWVGGHCIPVYPHLYVWTDESAKIVKVSREINESMASYAISKVEEEIGTLKDLNVLILGVGYRSGVKEVANSGAFFLRDKLERLECRVTVFDDLYSENEISSLGLIPYTGEVNPEIIIIHTEQPSFSEQKLDVLKNARIIFDGRNWLSEKLEKQFRILRI